MLRLLALVLAVSVLTAIDEAQVLAAARAASVEYQTRLRTLSEGLVAPSEAQRIDAVRALGGLRDPRSIPVLVPWLLKAERTPAELVAGITVLGRLGFQSPVPQLRSFAASDNADVRQAAVLALHQIGVINAGDWMLRAKEDDDALRLNALASLGHLSHAEAAEALVLGLAHSKPLVRQAACIGLGRLGDKVHGEKLAVALTDSDPMVRRYAAEALATLDYKAAVPNLLMALEANVAGGYIVNALRVLTGQDFGFDPNAPLLHRQEAIERGFAWSTANPGQ